VPGFIVAQLLGAAAATGSSGGSSRLARRPSPASPRPSVRRAPEVTLVRLVTRPSRQAAGRRADEASAEHDPGRAHAMANELERPL